MRAWYDHEAQQPFSMPVFVCKLLGRLLRARVEAAAQPVAVVQRLASRQRGRVNLVGVGLGQVDVALATEENYIANNYIAQRVMYCCCACACACLRFQRQWSWIGRRRLRRQHRRPRGRCGVRTVRYGTHNTLADLAEADRCSFWGMKGFKNGLTKEAWFLSAVIGK